MYYVMCGNEGFFVILHFGNQAKVFEFSMLRLFE
jgi:hypothetical protein